MVCTLRPSGHKATPASGIMVQVVVRDSPVAMHSRALVCAQDAQAEGVMDQSSLEAAPRLRCTYSQATSRSTHKPVIVHKVEAHAFHVHSPQSFEETAPPREPPIILGRGESLNDSSSIVVLLTCETTSQCRCSAPVLPRESRESLAITARTWANGKGLSTRLQSEANTYWRSQCMQQTQARANKPSICGHIRRPGDPTRVRTKRE